MGASGSKTTKCYTSLQSQGPNQLVDPNGFNLEFWMRTIPDETPFLNLKFPGSHNSATYMTKNFISVVKDFVACQDRSILDQLKCGIRYLDLRISLFTPKSNKQEIWCGHTFLTLPLDSVIHDIKTFLAQYPSETVILDIKPDYSPVNADWCGLANLKRKNRVRVQKPNYQVLQGIYVKMLGEVMYDRGVDWGTQVGEVRGRIIGYINLIVCERELVLGWIYFEWESMVQWDESVSRIEVPVFLGLDQALNHTDITHNISWQYFNWLAETNITLCKKWCQNLPEVIHPRELHYLAVEVTLEGMKPLDWVKEVLLNRKGLKSHGRQSKRYLTKWLESGVERDLLKRVTVISVDFASRGICKGIVGLNFNL